MSVGTITETSCLERALPVNGLAIREPVYIC
jgi:hypothetical protein